jgi:gliding motility associated protien GldN
MKKQWLILTAVLLCLCVKYSSAQLNEAGNTLQFTTDSDDLTIPQDVISIESNNKNRHILQMPHVHERDVMWEKRIWREIYVEQKMNQHFAYVKAPLIDIFMKEAKEGNLRVYHPINDEFTVRMNVCDLNNLGGGYDTVLVYNPETYTDSFIVVHNEFKAADVVSYRLKEVWYFDSKLSRLNVRILGIAPIAKRYDNRGNLVAIMPLFWVYYPDARDILTENDCYNPYNDADRLTWDDIFQARYFSSIITKQSNMHDRRIIDYAEGVDGLYEAERIHNEIFNFEQDLWSR